MTSKERVLRAIEFRNPDRIPLFFWLRNRNNQLDLPYKEVRAKYEAKSDILAVARMDPLAKLKPGFTEWGYQFTTFGETMGEMAYSPLSDWSGFEEWKKQIPDFSLKRSYVQAKEQRLANPDKFVVGLIGMQWEEMINLRGYENLMIDFYEEEDNLRQLIDIIHTRSMQAVDCYAEIGCDAVMCFEDWGVQTSMMMALPMWKDFFEEPYRKMINRIHEKGMKYILHSCGHITGLIDTFIDLGIDVLQQDQQRNMGLDELGKWKGKICFLDPIDIQHSPSLPIEEFPAVAEEMLEKLSVPSGGFIYNAYHQPWSIHLSPEGVEAEIESFIHASYPKEEGGAS